jgi:hypothetical protein
MELPVWMPGAPNAGTADCRKALREALEFRPLVETAQDALAWDRSVPSRHPAARASPTSGRRRCSRSGPRHTARGPTAPPTPWTSAEFGVPTPADRLSNAGEAPRFAR